MRYEKELYMLQHELRYLGRALRTSAPTQHLCLKDRNEILLSAAHARPCRVLAPLYTSMFRSGAGTAAAH